MKINFRKKKQFQQKMTKTATIAVLLILFAGMLMASLPEGWATISTQAFIQATPQTIAVGGQAYIVGWVTPVAPITGARYHNYVFTITLPDGTTDKVTAAESNVEATYSFSYTCNKEGTYSVQLFFAGEYDRLGSTSETSSWTAKQGYVAPTSTPVSLPSGNWQYPIDAQNIEWYQISGGWLQSSNVLSGTFYNASGTAFNPYSKGPNSAHLLWAKQLVPGGLLGGQYGATSQLVGEINYLIVACQGRMYYTEPGGMGDTLHPVLVCLDQFTGKEIYRVDLPATSPATGSNLNFEISPFIKTGKDYVTAPSGIPGVYSLWITGGGAWEVDPFTGRTLYYNSTLDPYYFAVYNDGAFYFRGSDTITKWNTRTKAVEWVTTVDPGEVISPTRGTHSPMIYDNLAIIPGSVWHPDLFHIRTLDTATGKQVLNSTDLGYTTDTITDFAAYGKFYIHLNDRRVHAIDLITGKEAWKSEPMEYPWGTFPAYGAAAAYGNVYFGSYDGYMYCFNAETGSTVWKYSSGYNPDTASKTSPFWGTPVVADGKVYVATGEHTPPSPIPKGYALYALDAYTGKLVWEYPHIYGEFGYGGIASGVLWYGSRYDGRVYVFGQGTTKTTVAVSQNPATTGSSTVIQGMITDQSSGQPDTPAVSKDSMVAQMEYIYNNGPAPTNAKGVPITITATGPDGKATNVATVTSDGTGKFAANWNPTAEGMYSITASFVGDDSYYGSSANTFLFVSSAQSKDALSVFGSSNLYIVFATIIILIAIAIAVLLIRRKS